MKRALTVAEIVLVSPAVLFFAALFLRNFLPADAPSNGPEQLVMWYSGRQWTLWLLLILLPLSALGLGGSTLLRSWHEDATLRQDARRVLAAIRAHPEVALTSVATVAAACALLLVALHMAGT